MVKNRFKSIIRPCITTSIVLGLSAYLMIVCWNGLNETYVEDQWQTTEGIILNPNLKLSGKENIARKNQGLHPIINYEYTLNGITYQSNSISNNVLVHTEDFPEGKAVFVYYNPKDPTKTVLVRSKVQKQYLYGTLLFCAFLAFVTIILFVKDIRYTLKY